VTASDEAQPKPTDTGSGTEPRAAPLLKPFEVILLAVSIAGAVGVSGIGLYASYSTLSAVAAERWGWASPWVLPVGMDLAIPAFTIGGLFLVRFDIPVGWVPFFPRALTAATVYLNWSADRTFQGRLGHATLVMLWVVFSEIAGRVYAHFAHLRDTTRMEKVRRIRWVLAPLSTVSLWRRMQLWEITSYRDALAMERNRRLVRADLRERFGRWWRRRTPRPELVRLGELVPADIIGDVRNRPEPSGEPAAVRPAGTPEPADANQVQGAAEPGPNLRRTTPKRTSPKAPRNQPEPAAEPTAPTPPVGEQVRQILDLIEAHGYDTVKLGFVREHTGMSKTTAYNRLVEARATWAEERGETD
jgi:hypothetical protein